MDAGDEVDGTHPTGAPGADRDAATPRRRWTLRKPLPPRPPVVRDWRWGLGVLGRVLIVGGLLIIAFVGYQLWGTGIEFRANQRALASDFARTQESIVAASPTAAPTVAPTTAVPLPSTTTAPAPGVTGTPTPATTAPATTVPRPTLPPISLGDVVGRLQMPSISGGSLYLVAGVRVEDLKHGVGHYPSTPLPGEYGNAALAGHRTTYGAPFGNLDRLKPGDRLIVDTLTGEHYEYVVDGWEIIKPTEVRVLAQPDDPTVATLTLTTCHPKKSTKQRLVVHSHLDAAASSPLEPRTANYQAVAPATVPTTAAPATVPATTVSPPASEPATTLPATTVAPTTVAPATPETLPGEAAIDQQDAGDLARGWFHDRAAWPQIVLWGALLVLISVAAWRFGLWMGRPWTAYVVGFAPFVVVLYFVFQNVNRLLPPGL